MNKVTIFDEEKEILVDPSTGEMFNYGDISEKKIVDLYEQAKIMEKQAQEFKKGLQKFAEWKLDGEDEMEVTKDYRFRIRQVDYKTYDVKVLKNVLKEEDFISAVEPKTARIKAIIVDAVDNGTYHMEDLDKIKKSESVKRTVTSVLIEKIK